MKSIYEPNMLKGLEGKVGEPWVKLPRGEELVHWTRDDLVAYNQINRHTEKALFFQRVFDFLTDNRIIGDYFEFGCHRCRTFRMALTEARRHNLSTIKFLAFDSFEGLPEPKSDAVNEIWKSGALATSEVDFMQIVQDHGIYIDNVLTFKGFYNQSLTNDLQKELLDRNSKAMLVNIDCDLYESAIPVFNFLDPLLQDGTVIYIDDLFTGYKGSPNKGVARAFLEYQEMTQWKFLPYLHIGWWGRAYITYSGSDIVEGVI
jgi:hypothetical protein